MADPPEPIIFSTCVNGERFAIFEAILESNDARDFCQQRGGDLGPVRGAEEFSKVTNLIRQSGFFTLGAGDSVQEHFFLGLEVPADETPVADPLQFEFVAAPGNDEVGLDFYHVGVGEFPWRADQPNNGNGAQNCGVILFQDENAVDADDELVDGLVEDVGCGLESNIICREPCAEFVADVVIEGQTFKLVHDLDSELVYLPIQGDELCARFSDEETEFEFAKITNATQLNGLRQRVADGDSLSVQLGENVGFAIGLVVPEESQINREDLDTTVFQFSDGTTSEFINGEGSVFPWQTDQPNNLGGNQQCAQLLFGFANQEDVDNFDAEQDQVNGCFNDVDCTGLLMAGYFCSAKPVEVVDGGGDGANEGNDDNNVEINDLVLLGGLSGMLLLLLLIIGLFIHERRQIRKIESILLIADKANTKSTFADSNWPRSTLPTLVSQDV